LIFKDKMSPLNHIFKDAWLWSTKLFGHWSVSVEQSAAGNQDDITDTRTVLWPAENLNVSSQLLRVSAAVIIFIIRLHEIQGIPVTDALELAEDRSFWQQIATAGCYG